MENNNRVVLIVVGVVVFIVLCFGGWLVYDKFFGISSTQGEESKTSTDFDKYKKDLNYLFENNGYKVYKLNCSNNNKVNNELYESCDEDVKEQYYLYNEKLFSTINMYTDVGKSNDYFIFTEYSSYSDIVYGLLDIKNKLVITDYEDYSCGYHSDVSASLCRGDKTTLFQGKNGKFGIYSFTSNKLILPVEYDTIFSVDIDKYIVEKNGKYGLIDGQMNYLFKLEYDFIGYNSKIGYILIKNNNIYLYDSNLIQLDVSQLSTLYENALYEEENIVYLDNSNSYYWMSGSYLTKMNMNKTFYINDDQEESFTYTGTYYLGEKLIIFDQYGSCHDNAKIYVINNNIEIISSDDIISTTSCW